MNIIVCIKQVPDTAEVRIDPVTKTLIREGVPAIVNPFDLYAAEEAIRLKERYGGKTIAISMGPPQAEEALREVVSMGIDEAILITDEQFRGSDTLATSYTLAKAIQKLGDYDLILCGKQAIDGDTAQVGPGIAEWLSLPQVTYVGKIEAIKDNKARVWRLIEGGHEILEAPLPAVFTVVKEINEPRLPSLRGKLRAKSMTIPQWGAKDLEVDLRYVGLEGSPTQVVEIFTPEIKKGGEIFHGPIEEGVEKLYQFLKERGFV